MGSSSEHWLRIHGVLRWQLPQNSNGSSAGWVSWKEGHSHPADVAPRQVPFSIFTATVVYPARPLRRKAVALTTFPNSPSPRVFPRTKLFRGNSHFGSSCVRVEMGPLAEKGERSDGQS